MNVALDRGHQHFAACLTRTAAAFRLLRLHERHQVRHRFFHHAGAAHHLRQEHFAGAEQVADYVHAVHKRPLNDVQRPFIEMPALFHVRVDIVGNSLNQGVFQSLDDRQLAPGLLLCLGLFLAADGLGELHEPFRGVRPAVEQHVLDAL